MLYYIMQYWISLKDFQSNKHKNYIIIIKYNNLFI